MNSSEPIYNVFHALGVEDSESLTAVSVLASKIIKTIQARNLSDAVAAEIAGCPPSRIDQICRADLADFTLDELCRYLVALGQNVSIAVEASDTSEAHLKVVG
jgi:predicted XRE-type DNA-binding protein